MQCEIEKYIKQLKKKKIKYLIVEKIKIKHV